LSTTLICFKKEAHEKTRSLSVSRLQVSKKRSIAVFLYFFSFSS